jgi:hypothetical protein
VHALHTVHALPDLCIAAGRLRDGVSVLEWINPFSTIKAVVSRDYCYGDDVT